MISSTKNTRKIAVPRQRNKRRVVEQETTKVTTQLSTKSVNELLTEAKKLLKEAY